MPADCRGGNDSIKVGKRDSVGLHIVLVLRRNEQRYTLTEELSYDSMMRELSMRFALNCAWNLVLMHENSREVQTTLQKEPSVNRGVFNFAVAPQ